MSSKRALKEGRLTAFFTLLSSDLAGIDGDEVLNFARDRLAERAEKRAKYHNPQLKAQAWEKFLALNAAIGTYRPRNNALVREMRDFIHHVLSNMSRVRDTEVGEGVDFDFLLDNWRFGPGASQGVTGTHTAEKLSQKFTVTRSAGALVQRVRSRSPYLSRFDAVNGGGLAYVSGSRMTTVPKSRTAVRTIAIEPSGNMALQLAAGLYLEGALRAIGLDIRSQQPKNQRLAQRGSADGSLATIDLSSASDMISPYLVRELFPYQWYMLFMRLRSPSTRIPKIGEVKLNMISTMGNGFTFPLMTLIFVAMIYAYRRVLGLDKSPTTGKRLRKGMIDWDRTAVFGDDIIVPTDEYDVCTRSLTELGLVVNTDKSYSTGLFRESCGGDYYMGREVTPFYVQSLATPAEIYTAINQVLSFCARHRIILYKCLKYLWQLCGSKPFLIPEWHNPDQGVLYGFLGGGHRYKYLRPSLRSVALKDKTFTMMLACGGYITGWDASGQYRVGKDGEDVLSFSPRPLYQRYKVGRTRVGKPYLDSRCADLRTASESQWVGLLVDLLT